MGIIMYLAIFMVILGGFFLFIFLSALKNGQFEDLETPSHKLLIDDTVDEKDSNKKNLDDRKKEEFDKIDS